MKNNLVIPETPVKPEAQGTLAATACSVFEAVDATSDEQYYTIGIWTTLDSALETLRKRGNNPPGDDSDDCVVVEIRERKVGTLDWSQVGKTVWKFVWEKKYDDSDDTDEWHVSETPNDKLCDAEK